MVSGVDGSAIVSVGLRACACAIEGAIPATAAAAAAFLSNSRRVCMHEPPAGPGRRFILPDAPERAIPAAGHDVARERDPLLDEQTRDEIDWPHERRGRFALRAMAAPLQRNGDGRG